MCYSTYDDPQGPPPDESPHVTRRHLNRAGRQLPTGRLGRQHAWYAAAAGPVPGDVGSELKVLLNRHDAVVFPLVAIYPASSATGVCQCD